jgi:hypothetical protein
MSDDTFLSTPRRPTYLPSLSLTTLASQSKGRENSWCSWELNEAVKVAPSPQLVRLGGDGAVVEHAEDDVLGAGGLQGAQ